MRHIYLFLCLFVGLTTLYSQVKLVERNKPVSRIVLTDDNPVDKQAAELLQDFIFRISKATLPIVSHVKTGKGDIIFNNKDCSELTEDGFRLQTQNRQLHISSGGNKGSIYRVVTLLEDYLNVYYYTAHTYDLEERPTIIFPEINRAENPAFRYRQTQSYAIWQDPVYKMWFRLEQPSEVFVDNL